MTHVSLQVSLEKQPAHVVLLTALKEAVSKLHWTQVSQDRHKLAGAMCAHILVLRTMLIPHQDVSGIVASLRLLSEEYPTELLKVEELIVQVEQNLNPILSFYGNHGDFATEDGIKLVKECGLPIVDAAIKMEPDILSTLKAVAQSSKDGEFVELIDSLVVLSE